MPSGFPGLSFEPLDEHHDRAAFDCGEENINAYLHERVLEDRKRGAAVAYVAVEPPSVKVVAYYTLSNASIAVDRAPKNIKRKLPRYPTAPATLVGRMGVTRERQGQGMGTTVLMDALHRSWMIARSQGSSAVIVDAKTDALIEFYERFGFTSFKDRPRNLLLPMKTIAGLFA